MKNIYTSVLALSLLLTLSEISLAGDVPERLCESDKHQSTLGTDAAAWALGGYSAFYSSLSGKCRIVLEVWQIEVPGAVIELSDENKGEGWNRKIDRGYSMYLDTFYTPVDVGWYSGMIFSTFGSTVTRDDIEGEAKFRSYEILLRFGYKWNLGEHFSIEPWFAAGPLWADGPSDEVGGEKFSENLIQVISTVHLNYKFNP